MIKYIIAALLALSAPALAQDVEIVGNEARVPIIHPGGGITCCCPPSQTQIIGTNLYCVMPVAEFDAWKASFAAKKPLPAGATVNVEMHREPGPHGYPANVSQGAMEAWRRNHKEKPQ